MLHNFIFKAFAVPIIIFQLAFATPALAQQGIPPTSSNHSQPPIENLNISEIDETDLSVAENIEQVTEEIQGKSSESPLDTFDLLPQDVYNEINPNQVDVSALTLVNDQDQIISDTRSGKIFSGKTQNFKIVYQGHKLNGFRIPIKAAMFCGKYLIFVKENTNDLSFIDLDFFRPALGRTALAVFRIPVETETPLSKLNIINASPVVDETPVPLSVLNFYNGVQITAFNVTAGLVDPDSVGQAQILGDNLSEFFNKALALRSDQLASEMENVSGSQGAFAKLFETLDPKTRVENFTKDKFIDATALSISNNFKAQRGLMARIPYLWAQMSIPRPLASPKIVQALSLVAAGLGSKSLNRTADFKEGLLQLANHRGIQMGAAVVTGAALGYLYPQEVAQFFYGGLDITKTVMELALGKARAIAVLGGHAFKATLAGFNPMTFKKTYLTKEAWSKLKYGLPAVFTTLYLSLGIPHLIVNTSKLVKELKATNLDDYGRQEQGWFSAFTKFLVNRENKAEQEYLGHLSAGEAKAQGQDSSRQFTEQENIEAETLVEELKEKYQGPISSMIGNIRNTKKNDEIVKKTDSQITSSWGALAHFLFSTASLTNSARAYSIFWSYWMIVRYMVWTPYQFAMALLHPEMFKVAAQGHYPNELNGGTRWLGKDASLRLTNKEYHAQVLEFEDKVIDVEGEIYKAAFKQSFKALVQYMDNNEDLQKIYRDGGIKSLSDKRLDKLSNQQQKFFRDYFNKLSEGATLSYLKDLAAKNNIVLGADDSTADIKEQVVPLSGQMGISESEGALYVEGAATPAVYNEALEESKKTVNIDAALETVKTKLIMSSDPANNSAARRNAVVLKQLDNPQAVARAVRSMIASNIVDKPIELLFTFVCLAGITTGFMKPIQDTMFGPNSWFFLSRVVFASGFVYDVISGVLADTWLKLQQDELHEGQFDKVPTGEDAEGSYFKWFMKQSFKNDKNTLWQNHKHFVKIIWGNMKPAFTMTMLVGILTMGRLDVDTYLVGYMLSYSVPLSSFYWKLEQGFELAASYFYKDVPENLRAHPEVQKFVNGEIGKRRLWFNFVEKFYKNIFGFMMNNFSQMTTAEFGSRSLSRIIFAGFTPTELVVKGFEKVKEVTAFVPGSETALSFCERLLAKNYTDFKKIPRPASLK